MKQLIIIAMGIFSLLLGSCVARHIKSVDVDTFGQELSADGVQLLDVRTSAEYAEGHIAGAKNIDVKQQDFVVQATNGLDKGQPVYLYCRSGRRSMLAAQMLSKAGYDVVNLRGGIIDWVQQGKPTTIDVQ